MRRDGITEKVGRARGLSCSTELLPPIHICFCMLRTLVLGGLNVASTAYSTATCSGQECICYPSAADALQAGCSVCVFGRDMVGKAEQSCFSHVWESSSV